MKKRLVLWGTNEKDEKILVAIELVSEANALKIHSFSEKDATELFYNRMINEWRIGKTLDFPESVVTLEKELSVTENLLPDDIRVDRTDLINRAKTEWHFIVLSSKLYEIYNSELSELKAKIEELSNYSQPLWDDMKGFWDKVQAQVREKNLFREHANELRNSTNALFEQLKALRKSFDDELNKISKENLDKLSSKMEEIEKKIGEGLGLQPIFEELKKLQHSLKNIKLNRKDRNKAWNRVDKAFKHVKEKKYGKSSNNYSATDRLSKRYNGLLEAIKKMENSINRDKKDRNFQDRRIEVTEGQLEAQIRQAKIKMIEERINSKNLKLEDMLKTKMELEKKMEVQKDKEAKQKEKENVKKTANELKSKMAEQIKQDLDSRKEDEEKLKSAANKLKAEKEKKKNKKEEDKKEEDQKESGKKKDTLVDAIGATLGEAIEDVVDTVKAVAEVVSDKIEDAVESLTETGEEE